MQENKLDQGFRAAGEPKDEKGLSDISEANMPVYQQAASEVREAMYNALSVEQQKMLEKSKLKLIVDEVKVNSSLPGDHRQKMEEIAGEVEIDSSPVLVRLTKYSTTQDGEVKKVLFSADVDHRKLEEDSAKELFEFYFPVANAIDQSRVYPTPETEKVLIKKLTTKLLGK